MEDNIHDRDRIEILLEGLDENNMTSMLKVLDEISKVRKSLNTEEDKIRDMLKTRMKEKKWDTYHDEETDMSISLTMQKRETIDKEQLKEMLTEQQYAMVLKTTTFERLQIITPEMRKQLKKMVR